MLEEGTIDLIQRGLDGEIDEAGRLALNHRLERDPAARVLSEEMSSVSAFLASASPIEVPRGFAAAVMKDVRAHRTQRAKELAPVLRPGFGGGRKMGFQLALGLAAAAALVFFLAPSLFRSLDPAQLRGTMVAPGATPESWNIAAGTQSINVTTTETQVSLQFGSGNQAFDVVFDPANLRLESPGEATQTKVEPGVVHITLQNAPVLIRLRRNDMKAAQILVRVHQAGGRDLETRIEIPEAVKPAPTNFSR